MSRCKPKDDNLTAVLYGINDLRLEQRPKPEPKDHQVLLRMEVCGICGSDIHYVVHGRICDFVVEKPMILGHEASGTVLKVGKDVKNLKAGDRVAIEPGECCRLCQYCKEGRYNLCPDMAFCATPPYDGNLTRYYCHAADFCYKLPDSMSLEEGALMEPLAVGVNACKRGSVGVESIVLIFGAGPIGLVTVLAAKAYSASKVMIVDVLEDRLNLAKELGADYILKIQKTGTDLDIVKKVHETLGCEPNVSIDCSGAEQAIRAMIQATKSGGVIVLVGMGESELKIPLGHVVIREVDIRGSFRYVNDYQIAMELVESGKINVKPLITHHFTLEETLEAVETAKTGKGNPIKILIHANPEWKH